MYHRVNLYNKNKNTELTTIVGLLQLLVGLRRGLATLLNVYGIKITFAAMLETAFLSLYTGKRAAAWKHFQNPWIACLLVESLCCARECRRSCFKFSGCACAASCFIALVLNWDFIDRISFAAAFFRRNINNFCAE